MNTRELQVSWTTVLGVFLHLIYRLGPHFIVLLLDIWTYLDCAAAHLLAPVFSVLWSQVIDGKVTRVQSSRILFEPPVFSGPFFHPVLMPPVMFVGL